MRIEMILLGLVLDLILGDPPRWPHPVKLIGHLISWCEHAFNQPRFSDQIRRWLGVLLWIIVVLGTAAVTAGLMWLTRPVWWLHFLLGTYIAYTCLSVKGLAHEGRKIQRSLTAGNLAVARQQVGMIVGRDTADLSASDVTKATVETIAENTSDGVIAPLLCLFIGGPVLGLSYKAVNTLDSMVGYRNEQYAAIGWWSAKLDDIVNLIPARLTWCFLVLATWPLRLNTREAITVGRRDHNHHLSPNSGFAESVVAGALNVRLGGPHTYFGELVIKPYIGEETARAITPEDITMTCRLLYMATALATITLTAITWLITSLLA
ncbi:adenosylcobinamide-phosphate synthase CbiB [Furfurilactobacillus sp. WILCCON 0119]